MRTTLGGLPALAQALLEGDEVGFVAAHHAGHDEQDFAHRGSGLPARRACPDAYPSRVASGATPASLETVLLDKRSDLRHLRHEPGHGAVGHALDGAEGVVELPPQRVGVDQRGDASVLERVDLGGETARSSSNEACTAGSVTRPLLVELSGADVSKLAQARDQRTQMLLAGRGQA